jgi:hypothetical protein
VIAKQKKSALNITTDTVSSSSMMVLFSCAEIRRSECMNVKTGSEGQGE